MIFDKKQSIDVREIRRMLWRRRLVIALPLLIAVGAGVAGILLAEPQYASTATLAMETPAPLTREIAAATGTGGRGNDNDNIRILRKRIQSSSFLESVAVQIGLHESPRLIAKAKRLAKENPGHDERDLLLRECVRSLNRMLDIRAEGFDIFYVRAVSSSPDLAHAVATTVANQYIESTQKGKLLQSEEAYSFAQEQVAIYEAKLEEKRQQLREFEQETALKGIEASPISATNVSRVNTMIAAADADIEFLRGRHETAKSRVAEADLEAFLGLGLLKSPRLEALKSTLFELEKHLALTIVEFDETDTAVTSAKNQIAVKSQQLLSELESLAQVAFPSIVEQYRQYLVDYEYTQISLDAATRRRDEMKAFLERYASDLAGLPAAEFRLARLREEVASAERLYQTWLDQANSTQIAKAVQSASVGNQIVLIEPAQVPLAPFAPEKPKILALAVVMGLALGVGAAVVMEYLDLTLKSVDEIEMVLGVPILGAVPRMQAAVIEDLELRRRRRFQILIPAFLLTGLALAALAYWYFIMQGGGVG